jgi:hypothetical protein
LIIASVVGIGVTRFTDTGCFVLSLNTTCVLPLSARPIYIESIDLSCLVLFEPPVCPCTYYPILIDGHQNFFPVIISLGDRIEWIPFCLGNELISIVTLCTISIVNRFGIFLYGIIIRTELILSLRNRICLSTVSTCLSASHVVNVMLYGSDCYSCLIDWNAPSASIDTTLNTLLLLYVCVIFNMQFRIVFRLLRLTQYVCSNPMCCEYDIRNIIPFTCMMSIDR